MWGLIWIKQVTNKRNTLHTQLLLAWLCNGQQDVTAGCPAREMHCLDCCTYTCI